MCLFTALEQCDAESAVAQREERIGESLADINLLGCKVSVSLVNLRVEVYESFIASWEQDWNNKRKNGMLNISISVRVSIRLNISKTN